MRREPLIITTTATIAFQKLFLDIVGPTDKGDDGYQYILTLQCKLSKYIEKHALNTKVTVNC